MIREQLRLIISKAVAILAEKSNFPQEFVQIPAEVEPPKQTEHGDLATNFALVASKLARTNPRALAESLVPLLKITDESGLIADIEIAGPGFINFRLDPTVAARTVADILTEAEKFGQTETSEPLKINVEFVSVNPNGPITIGSGRGAAYGSTLCNVLEAAGHHVHREYYINDGVNSEQMRLFAESVKAIIEGREVPDNGYKGDYVHEVARLVESPGSIEELKLKAEAAMIERQQKDLSSFGVEFDTWFSEQSLLESGKVDAEFQNLVESHVADENPYRTKVVFAKGGSIKEVIEEPQPTDEDDAAGNQPTVWLRSTKFGDDQDRVLRRRDGRYTYIASDVAYHQDKFNRPPDADKLITILGPDHHGYIARLTAVVAASRLGDPTREPDPATLTLADQRPLDEHEAKIYRSATERDRCQAALEWAREHLEVQIFQIVRFLKDGKPAPMRKRDGNIYALIDLINEIGTTIKPEAPLSDQQQTGADVARFFYLMRHHDTALDFDLDLAGRQSDENPVFYVQYAHARIASVLRKAEESGFTLTPDFDPPRLTHPKELDLILKIADLPYEVRRTAEDYSVNRLTTYAIELARTYHGFYDSCRVLQPGEPELSKARLALCRATQIALANALNLLGISAPEHM